jgi:hypothetical protein
MAKVIEDIILIKFSQLVKDSNTEESVIAGHDIQAALEQVAQELVGDNVIVELERT